MSSKLKETKKDSPNSLFDSGDVVFESVLKLDSTPVVSRTIPVEDIKKWKPSVERRWFLINVGDYFGSTVPLHEGGSVFLG